MLIDDRAFDLGIYVLISSVEPLRIYRYNHDILLRFCSEVFYPFDQENIDKYLPSENYTPNHQYFKNTNYSSLDAFNAYLDDQGHDFEKLWKQIDDAIVSIFLAKADHIIRYNNFYHRKYDTEHFGILRFDFIIDEKLKAYLMEVNISPVPGEDSSERHVTLYEKVLYNTFSTVGLSNRVEFKPK